MSCSTGRLSESRVGDGAEQAEAEVGGVAEGEGALDGLVEAEAEAPGAGGRRLGLVASTVADVTEEAGVDGGLVGEDLDADGGHDAA